MQPNVETQEPLQTLRALVEVDTFDQSVGLHFRDQINYLTFVRVAGCL